MKSPTLAIALAALAGCLLAPLQVVPAQAAVTHKWAQPLNVFGARLYACRTQVATKQGIGWRISVRAANKSRVKVVASAKVTRTLFHPQRQVVKDRWATTLQRGRSSTVDTVFTYDRTVHPNKFYEDVTFTMRRVVDGQTLTWYQSNPRGIPSCKAAPTSLALQGSGYVNRWNNGRFQTCGSLLLDERGSMAVWRFRGDATHATRPLIYYAEVYSHPDFVTQRSWSRTFGPGGYTSIGQLVQSTVDLPGTGERAETFSLEVKETDGTSRSISGMGDPRNMC